MKTFTFFRESSAQILPVTPSKPSDLERELAKDDVGKRDALQKVSKKKGYANQARDVIQRTGTAPTPEDDQKKIDRAADTQRKADIVRFAKDVNPETGRVVASPAATVARKDIAKRKGIKPSEVTDDDFQGIIDAQKDKEEGQRIRDLVGAENETPQQTKERQNRLRRGQQTRMTRAAKAAEPGSLSGSKDTDRSLNKAFRKGEGETAFEPFKVPGTNVTVSKQSGQKHNLQPEVEEIPHPNFKNFPDPKKSKTFVNDGDDGDGYNYRYSDNFGEWQREADPDDVAEKIGLLADPKQEDNFEVVKTKDGEVVSRVKQSNTGWGENSQNFEPSRAEIDRFRKDPKGVKLLAAIDKGDAPTVQKLAFTNYAGEVGEKHPAVDEYLERTDLRTDISLRGLDNKKMEAMYGGTFDGDLGKAASKYQVKGAPEGVYNLKQIEKDGGKKGQNWKDPVLKELHGKILENRQYEALRTYIQQNMHDGYAWWEGIRSIEQMNLEHIQALNNPNNPGYDHPSNWVWASESLNKAKNATDLSTPIKKFEEPDRTYSPAGRGFPAFRDAAARSIGMNKSKLESELAAAAPAIKMNKPDYEKLEPEEIERQRDALVKKATELGLEISDEQLNNFLELPTENFPGYKKDPEAMERRRQEKETKRRETDTLLNDLRQEFGLSDLRYQTWPTRQKNIAKQALDSYNDAKLLALPQEKPKAKIPTRAQQRRAEAQVQADTSDF